MPNLGFPRGWDTDTEDQREKDRLQLATRYV